MKKILSIISIILVIATIFTITGCSKKETSADPTDNTSQTEVNQQGGENNKIEDKDSYTLSFTLNNETKQGFEIKIPNKYKEIIDVIRKNNDTEIYFVHKTTNLLAFKLIISNSESKDTVQSVKIGSYFINAFIGDEVNTESEDGKVIAEIQNSVKSIVGTISEINGVTTNTKEDTKNPENTEDAENKKEENKKNETTVPVPDELKDAEIGKEVSIGGKGSQDTAVKNEDGSITYYYTDENGVRQSRTVKPKPTNPPDSSPDKPIGKFEIDG